MVRNARNQTVIELGPATDAIATHCRLTPAVMKYSTTSPKPMARRSSGAWGGASFVGMDTVLRGASTGAGSLCKGSLGRKHAAPGNRCTLRGRHAEGGPFSPARNPDVGRGTPRRHLTDDRRRI